LNSWIKKLVSQYLEKLICALFLGRTL
jgi:hypothetical protein